MTIKELKKAYKEYLIKHHPELSKATIASYSAMAFLAYNKDIGFSLIDAMRSDKLFAEAKVKTADFLRSEHGGEKNKTSAYTDSNIKKYVVSLNLLKEFFDYNQNNGTPIELDDYSIEEKFYDVAKDLYLGNLSIDSAVIRIMNIDNSYSKATCNMIFNAFLSMMKGETFTRSLPYKMVDCFIRNISRDFGEQKRRNALISTLNMLNYYYDMTGQPLKEHRVICQKISDEFGDGISFDYSKSTDKKTEPLVESTNDNKNQITIIEAIVEVLKKSDTPLTAKEIYNLIVLTGLYSFGAKDPISVVETTLARACKDVNVTKKQKKLFFGCTKNGNGRRSYYLLSKEIECIKPNKESLIKGFERWMCSQGYAIGTAKTYTSSILLAEEFAKSHSLKSVTLFSSDKNECYKTTKELISNNIFNSLNKERRDRYIIAINKLLLCYGLGPISREKNALGKSSQTQENEDRKKAILLFENWMSEQSYTLGTISGYAGAIRKAEEYAKEHEHKYQELYTTSNDLCKKTVEELFSSNDFINYNLKHARRFSIAIKRLLECYGIESDLLDNNQQNHDISTHLNDITSTDNKSHFRTSFEEWLIGHGFTTGSAKGYSSAIITAERFAVEHQFNHTVLYTNDTNECLETTKELVNNSDFITFNKSHSNRFIIAIKKLLQSLKIDFDIEDYSKKGTNNYPLAPVDDDREKSITDFINWMISNGKSAKSAHQYISALSSAETYASDNGIKPSKLLTLDHDLCLKAAIALFTKKKFRNHNEKSGRRFSIAIVALLKSRGIELDYRSCKATYKSTNTAVFELTSENRAVIIDFEKWLSSEGYSPRTIKKYISLIIESDSYSKEMGIKPEALLSYDEDLCLQTAKALFSDEQFCTLNAGHFGQYDIAITKLLKSYDIFFDYKNPNNRGPVINYKDDFSYDEALDYSQETSISNIEKRKMDEDNYKLLNIENLNLSVRSFNALKRNGVNTIGELIECYENGSLPTIRNLGIKSIKEIEKAVIDIINNGFNVEGCFETFAVPEEIENISVNELKLSVRLLNRLLRDGYTTVGSILRMAPAEMRSIVGIGTKTLDELQMTVTGIKEKGIDDYIKERESEEKEKELNKRQIDIETVKRLKQNYGLKSAWLLEWYNVTRSRIQQLLNKRVNKGNWLNREMTESNKRLLVEMINSKTSYLENSDGTKAYFLCNKINDCAVIFVNDFEIKCFFLEMMPEEIRALIKDKRLDILTFEELNIVSSGSTVTILKQKYFNPQNSSAFSAFAKDRKMSLNDYCHFLTGMDYLDTKDHIDDGKIVDFLKSHYANGELIIPKTSSTKWFYSYISRQGITVDEIAEMFGFDEGSRSSGTSSPNSDSDDDMQEYFCESDNWIEKIYADNPLVGNKVLSEEEQKEVYTNSKQYIDKKMSNSHYKLVLSQKMEIALAVINYAKEWDTLDESGFWRYITTQFGYRDEANKLRDIICDCVFESFSNNHRWFLITDTGYQYKSTISVHALTTKRSWMLFYDFLFDFYKTNMEWTYIEDDPIVVRMVYALRNKLIMNDSTNEDSFTISTKVYSFQEGIRKLIIYKTNYAIKLVNSMLKRIDSIINHTDSKSSTYIEYLCDKWIEDKLKNAQEDKKSGKLSSTRRVAIDYSKIRPQYCIYDEKNVVIDFPDIRLKSSDFSNVETQVFVSDVLVDTKTLSYYGNELGKTLNGFKVDLNMCLLRGDGTLNVRVLILCDENTIYDSENYLYRKYVCFSSNKECDSSDCKRGGYSFFTTSNHEFSFSEADASTIEEHEKWSLHYVELKQGFVIRFDEQIIALDDNNDFSEGTIKIIRPAFLDGTIFVKDGNRYNVINGEKEYIIVAQSINDMHKYAVTMNSTRMDLDTIGFEMLSNGVAYHIPSVTKEDNISDFRVVDMEKDLLISNITVKVVSELDVRFNREFYFNEDDYKDAYVEIITTNGLQRQLININDEVIVFPFDDGLIEVKIPKISVRDTGGKPWKLNYTNWIKHIQQNEKIYASAPNSCLISISIDDYPIYGDKKGCFDFGDSVFAYSNYEDLDWASIFLEVTGKSKKQQYIIGRISLKEQFLSAVKFSYENGTLYWNCGSGFIGNPNSRIKLNIITDNGTASYSLSLEEKAITNNPGLPLDEYHYQIVKESESVFLSTDTVLDEGKLYIGDQNELRFRDCILKITSITNEDGTGPCSVKIKNTYIKDLKYEGIKFVFSEDRECPIYSGIMFFERNSEQHNFSCSESELSNGTKLYKINPVTIVFINDNTLSITNEDGDGIYYHRFYNKDSLENNYFITDREPTAKSRSTYYLADLYTYEKRRT